MKKLLTTLVFSLFSLALLRAQDENNIIPGSAKDIGSPMPELKVVDGKGNVYTAASFKDNRHFFVFLFNPTCGHCIKMARIIGGHRTLFKHNHVLFVAGPQMMPYLESFYKATDIDEFPKIKVGVDSAHFIDKVYTYSALPQINIYDKNRKLIKVFNGDTPIDSLKQYIP